MRLVCHILDVPTLCCVNLIRFQAFSESAEGGLLDRKNPYLGTPEDRKNPYLGTPEDRNNPYLGSA